MDDAVRKRLVVDNHLAVLEELIVFEPHTKGGRGINGKELRAPRREQVLSTQATGHGVGGDNEFAFVDRHPINLCGALCLPFRREKQRESRRFIGKSCVVLGLCDNLCESGEMSLKIGHDRVGGVRKSVGVFLDTTGALPRLVIKVFKGSLLRCHFIWI